MAFSAICGCIPRSNQIQPGGPYVNLGSTPFFAQSDYQCGPAALATVLVSSGVSITPDQLLEKVYIPERKGSLQIEMIAATRWYGRVPYLLKPQITDIIDELHQGRPVLVFQNLGWRIAPIWHYAVVTGYDPGSEQVLLRSGTNPEKRSSVSEFMRSWHRAGSWAFVALNPGELPANVDFEPYFQTLSDMRKSASPRFMVDLYATASRQFPDEPIVWFALANSYLETDNHSKAVESYLRVLALDQNHIAANNNLAYSLSRLSCHKAALDYAQQAVRLSELSGRFELESRDTLNQVRARMANDISAAGAACGYP